MSKDAKSQLLEFLKNLGYAENWADCFEDTELTQPLNQWRSTFKFRFADGRRIRGSGQGQRKIEAQIAASKTALENLSANHPDLLVDWDEIRVEAQRGDALIKLSVYLASAFESVGDKSRKLQGVEKDAYLETVFEQWKAQGDSDLAIWGDYLGKEHKATFVEALLWRRFGGKVLTKNAFDELQILLKTLE